MSACTGVVGSRLLTAVFSVVLFASGFLAQRSGLMYGFVALMIVAGLLLVLIHRRCHLEWSTVILVAVLLRVSVFWMPPGLSDDAYRYVWDGQVQQEGVNPYRYRPAAAELEALQGSELYGRLNSRDVYTVYPPLSQAVFYLGVSLSPDNWRTSYYWIKLIILLIEIAGLAALFRLSTPSMAVLYAWNPVVIIEIAGQGHTEGLAAGALLVALLLHRLDRHGGTCAALSAAGMAKLYPFVLLPPVWLRGRWTAPLASVAAIALLATPYAATYVIPHIAESLRLYVSYFEFNAGPYYAVKGILRVVTGDDLSKTVGPLFGVGFVMALPLIYYAAYRLRWTLEATAVALLSAFLLFSTTVHPWYLVPLLAVLGVVGRPHWHWYWLAILSMGTYLLYVDGPYWTFVILSWAVWCILAVAHYFDPLLQWVQRRRGYSKFQDIADWIPVGEELKILDLGAGEGYVGLAAAGSRRAVVELADVIDMHRVSLPFRTVSPDRLPYADDAFDYVMLYYVLHHAGRPERVLNEAVRVATSGVIVVESIYRSRFQRVLLTFLDRLANRIRSHGRMGEQEENLKFRTAPEWVQMVKGLGLDLAGERETGNWIHTRLMLLVRA